MASSKLTPTDSRVSHNFAVLNGRSYHFLQANPTSSSPPVATIFLIHGWPDFSFGWRHQILFLLSMNYRVIAPDMMGYGLSAAPSALSSYTFKTAADDMAALAAHLNVPRIILLGHDWGGAIVYRIAMWYPNLVSAIISVCTPFAPPLKTYVPLEEVVKKVPNFKYQVQLASGEVETVVKGKEKLRQFINATYGGWGSDRGTVGFNMEHGTIYENLEKLKKTVLLSDQELDFYAENFARNGLGPPLNWYRTRGLNFLDEKVFIGQEIKFKAPTLFICAVKDEALPPWMSQGMGRSFDSLTKKEVDAGHWALIQKPAECNGYIKEFLDGLLLSSSVKANL